LLGQARTRHDGGRVRDYVPPTATCRSASPFETLNRSASRRARRGETVRSSKKPDSEVVLPVTVRLPKSAIEQLESAAAGQGVTRSEYVRALLVEPRLPKIPKLSPTSRDRMVSIKILSEINRAGRQIESAVLILERAAEAGRLNNDIVDRAAVEIASFDSALREALAHAVKD
jgi:hypothetical protein